MRARRSSVLRRLASACPAAGAALALGTLLAPTPVRAIELFEGRVQIHGAVDGEWRLLADGFASDRAYLSQWVQTLSIETELDLLPDGFGPFDAVSGFVRVDVRYDCVWTKLCGISRSYDFHGDRAIRLPKNFTDGRDSGYTGVLSVEPPERIHRAGRLVQFEDLPALKELKAIGARGLEETLAPLTDDALFAFKDVDGSLGPGAFPLGPWRPKVRIDPIGLLRTLPSPTTPDLPLRPRIPTAPDSLGGAQGIYVPSRPLRERLGDFDAFDQNFREKALAWNHGAGQDEHELKEAYLDIETLESHLFLRIGRQSIVWGKTELFRTTDQFNPQDIALSTLPSLEESRLPLWSVRGIYSFYDVGPFEDVRLELAAIVDDFEPIDIGKCGEPYTVWLVCGKSFGLVAHGIAGVGLAGEERPPDPWDDVKGFDVGARVEFRWDRYSFAITDFWGYADAPTIEAFHGYERKVDPETGRPLDLDGRVLDPAAPDVRERALALGAGNRQIFDFVCGTTVGLAEAVFAGLSENCLLDLLNVTTPLSLAGFTIAPSTALASVFAGGAIGNVVVAGLTNGGVASLVPLDIGANEGPAPPPGTPCLLGASCMSQRLTDPQEALFGCGVFYGTNCDVDGVDFYNAEASVLLQSFPQFDPGGPVATRFVNGRLLVLPGARGPGDEGYDPLVDGVPPPGFRSELAAASANFMSLLAALSDANPADTACVPTDPISCGYVRAVFALAGSQRPEARAGGNGRYGRRDFLWHSGAQLAIHYQKRNVLGFAMDFAEDRSGTNWSLEATWSSGEEYGNSRALRGYSTHDTFGLTISVDRPTFIRFLNPARTFFFNSQVFTRYIADYAGAGSLGAAGPYNVLATFTAATGYFQDRMIPAVTAIYDVGSNSGGFVGQISYRMTEVMTLTFGFNTFYGGPGLARIPERSALPGNAGPDYRTSTNYDGLVPIEERDELFVRLRYTF